MLGEETRTGRPARPAKQDMTHHTTEPGPPNPGPAIPEPSPVASSAAQLARLAQQKAIRARRRRQQRQAREPDAAKPPGAPAPRSPSQRQGWRAESLALRHLEAAGLVLLARNLACRAGEIDLVCRDGAILVFVEVRARRDARFGGAAASIGRSKQQRLTRAAQYWLPSLCRRYFQGRPPPCRFDAVTLDGAAVHWIRHAFTLEISAGMPHI